MFAGLCALGMSLLNAAAWAQDAPDSCQPAVIKDAFQQYVQTVTKQRVIQIQQRLNGLGYGPIDSDGVLGADTRLALQRFCRAHAVQAGAADIAATLVELLDQAPAATTPAAATPSTAAESERADTVGVYYRWSPPQQDSDDGQSQDNEQGGEPQPVADATLPDPILEALSGIAGIAYANATLFESALAQVFAGSNLEYRPYLDDILAQARVEPGAKLNPIQVSGADCGCSGEHSSLVYGFYPYWLADGTPQALDFSLFDRIAFYALTLNAEGDIQSPLQWSDDWDAAGFINLAHKYRVAVDVTIQARGWQAWDGKRLRRAVGATVEAVTQQFTPSQTSLLNDPLTLFEGGAAVRGDGVTLVFDNYTESAGKRANLITFVNQVAQRLAERERDYHINILLDLDVAALDQQAALSDLESILLDSSDGDAAPVNYVFVFLQQPTSDAKKILRRNIEDEFRGAQRKAVLRKIVPVISPDGHADDPRGAFTQFTDDLIYFQDNFAGVGLWPLPLASDADMAAIKSRIVELYSAAGDDDHIGGLVDQYMPGLCQFACPNRWAFRLAFDLLVAVLGIYALVAIWVCRLRSFYKQHFLYFAAAGLTTLLIFIISLICDPYWQARADAVIASLGVLIALVMTVRYVSRATRPPLP